MTAGGTSLDELARDTDAEASRLDRELEEIELLVQQARTESARHEQKRAQAAERLAGTESRREPIPVEISQAIDHLTTMTKRASLMEAQIDILVGKQRALTRYRDRIRDLTGQIRAAAEGTGSREPADPAGAQVEGSRAVLQAQEDLRREIARAMHDGPAQSLTNIALQAQIVQRLVDRDPARAGAEVGQLIEMVQQTLEATKTFIFDVRPMVLDDLGLVPTLRRAARDRGRKAQVPIQFDSVGADRRLANDVESGLFRIIDDAIAGYVSTQPARVVVSLDWSDSQLEARVSGLHTDELAVDEPAVSPDEPAARRGGRLRGRAKQADEMPAALAQMIEEQREDAAAATEEAARALAAARALPGHTWKQIEQRARGLGLTVSLSEDGQELVAVAAAD
jgi:two-component system sensor histidine kinase DegS